MDRWSETVFAVTQNIIAWLMISLLAGFGYVVRRVLTSQREIEMLRQELAFREEARRRDSADIQALNKKVDGIYEILLDMKGEKE